MTRAMPTCRILLMQPVCLAFCFALARAGNSIAARIAMMAITTKSSIKVNAPRNPLERRQPRWDFNSKTFIFMMQKNILGHPEIS